MALLEVKNLETVFKTDGGEVQAVRNVSFEVAEGEKAKIEKAPEVKL